MDKASVHHLLGQTDIYLIDQILKNRYASGCRLLDAGCGRGRNLAWFLQQEMEVYGIDQDPECIKALRAENPGLKKEQFQCCAVEAMPFEDDYFDHVISSAVLHFAESEDHFLRMMAEMVRVLKPGGSLFIRMTTDRTIENLVQLLDEGRYLIPDGSIRFLLTRACLQELPHRFNLSMAEPFKTVHVDDLRSMSVLVMLKNGHSTDVPSD